MFSHSNPSLLPLVGDLVPDVFLALDMSYDEMSPLFCTVLHSLMKALARWFLSSVGGTSENKGTKKAWREQDQLNVHRFLLDYHKQKDLVEQCTEHPEIPPLVDFEEDIDGPDVKAELPAHIAKEAMERCIHLPTDHLPTCPPTTDSASTYSRRMFSTQT